MLVHGSDHVHAGHLPNCVVELDGGDSGGGLHLLLILIGDADVLVVSAVPGLEVPGHLGCWFSVNWLLLKLELLAGLGPDLVLVQVVTVDDGGVLPGLGSIVWGGLAGPTVSRLVIGVDTEAVALTLCQARSLEELLWSLGVANLKTMFLHKFLGRCR